MIKDQIKHTELYQTTRRGYWNLLSQKDRLTKRIRRRTQYLAAPFYLARLKRGVNRIKTSSLTDLHDVTKVEKIISDVGLTYDKRRLYGRDNKHMNFGPGLWQIPRQLAQALCLLSALNIKTMLEIGTYNGWTTSVVVAYLSRFNADFTAITVDKYPQFTYYNVMRKYLPVTFLAGKTVEDVQHNNVDLCFIDGNHDYLYCRKDYDLAGQYARVCMFHDINDKFVGFDNVPRLWRELKMEERDSSEFHEFTYHSHNEKIMGIGIRVRGSKREGWKQRTSSGGDLSRGTS